MNEEVRRQNLHKRLNMYRSILSSYQDEQQALLERTAWIREKIDRLQAELESND